MSPRPGRRRLAVLLVVLLAAAGCGIPLDDQPELISADDLPRALQPSSSTTTELPIQESDVVAVYLVDLVDPAVGSARLVPVVRQVPQGSTRAERERATLQHLLDGPTTEEQQSDNLTSMVIPSGDEPISVIDISHPTEDQVSVVLSESPAIEGRDRVTSFAQIVYTLTQFPDTATVSFQVRGDDGDDTPIPVKTDTEEGDVTRPVGRSDYSTLAPTPFEADS